MNVCQRCQRHRRKKIKILDKIFKNILLRAWLMHFTPKNLIFAYFSFLSEGGGQANIGRSLFPPVSLTPPENLSVVSLTPVNSFRRFR